MTTYITTNKSSAPSWNNTSESTLPTWTPRYKGGLGWTYDQADINYDSLTEENSGNKVLYDSLGTLPVWINLSKS